MQTSVIPQFTCETRQRFWEKVALAGQDDCWVWTGAIDKWGYGKFSFFSQGRKCQLVASRFAYTDVKGAIPPGELILHSCDNPTCVNPNHLFAGTHQRNMQEMKARGRAYKPRGLLNCNARLKPRDVLRIRGLLAKGEKPGVISSRFHVSRDTVSSIQTGRSWAWLE